MIRWLPLLLTLTFGGALTWAAQGDETPASRTVAGLRDKARPLLLFAPSASDPRFQAVTLMATSHTAELLDRQIVIFSCDQTGDLPSPDTRIWQSCTGGQAALRRQFRVAPAEFVVVLIGKDGGEKKRWHQPVTFEQLRDTIDAMPMRQDEMRHPRN